MTLAEALTELGVQRGTNSDEVRRAYLRLIKIRKPETDPAGFQRVREAYDLLRGLGPMAELLAQEAEGTPGERSAQRFRISLPMKPTESLPSSSASPHAEPEPARSPQSSQKHDNDIAFEGFVSAWNAVPPAHGMGPRVEIAREAVASRPAEPRTHWLLVKSLSIGSATDRELADALRAGWRAAGAEFLEELLVRLPHLASPEEVEAGLASPSMSLRLAAAGALAPRNPERASAAVREMIEATTQDGIPHLHWLLNVILTLFKNDDPQPAVAAQSVLRARVKEQEKEVEIAGGPLGAIWIFVEELAALPPGFPARVRRELAPATLEGEMQNVATWILAQARMNRRQVRRWRKSLGPGTPNIASLMDGGLKASRSVGLTVAWLRMGMVGRLILTGVLLSSVRICLTAVWPGNQPARPNSVADADVDGINNLVAELCAPTASSNPRIPCRKVEFLYTAVRGRKCGLVGRAFREARDSIVQRAPSVVEVHFLVNAAAAISKVCPEVYLGRIMPGEPAP